MGRAEDLFDKIKKEGETAIDGFIMIRKAEELFLDFKQSADDGSGTLLHDNDRKNLAKAISGFGNSEGGVVVWGVHCAKDKYDVADVAKAKRPLINVSTFVSWLEGAVSGCTVPPHGGVLNYPIDIGSGKGFVVTYIPKSVHAPHQTVKENQFYMRAGSSFHPVPYGILAGMFGRRPQPEIVQVYRTYTSEFRDNQILFRLAVLLRNNGAGIATDLFINASFHSPGVGSRGDFQWKHEMWMGTSHPFKINVISNPELRLAPGAECEALSIVIHLSPPFTEDFRIAGDCGCGQSPLSHFELFSSREKLLAIHEDIRNDSLTGGVSPSKIANLSAHIFGREKL